MCMQNDERIFTDVHSISITMFENGKNFILKLAKEQNFMTDFLIEDVISKL